MGRDLWHMRSLVFTDKPDFMIGNSYGKFIQRDTLYNRHSAPLLSRIGIHGDIAFAEQVEQRLVMGFQVRHDFGECR